MEINNKGFTLVELLATLVILALIILIVVPQVQNIIQSSKSEASLESARSYLDAAEHIYSNAISDETINIHANLMSLIKVSGTQASSGKIFYDKENNLIAYLMIDKKCFIKLSGSKDIKQYSDISLCE